MPGGAMPEEPAGAISPWRQPFTELAGTDG
jgi:hypothetical protein